MPTSSRTALRFSRCFAFDAVGNGFLFRFFVRGYRTFRNGQDRSLQMRCGSSVPCGHKPSQSPAVTERVLRSFRVILYGNDRIFPFSPAGGCRRKRPDPPVALDACGGFFGRSAYFSWKNSSSSPSKPVMKARRTGICSSSGLPSSASLGGWCTPAPAATAVSKAASTSSTFSAACQ